GDAGGGELWHRYRRRGARLGAVRGGFGAAGGGGLCRRERGGLERGARAGAARHSAAGGASADGRRRRAASGGDRAVATVADAAAERGSGAMSAAVVLAEAIRAGLAGHAPLAEGLAGVFDAPPPRAATPHAVIGEAMLSDWGTKDMAGREARVVVTL